MRGPLRRLAVLALIGAASASCIRVYSGRSGIRADPLYLEERGEAVFERYGIPVAERFVDYRVHSGPFMVDDVWGRGAIEDRVHCDLDSRGDPLARGARVRMTVTLDVAYGETGSRIALASSGRTMPILESEGTARCRLRAPFVEEVLGAIAGNP